MERKEQEQMEYLQERLNELAERCRNEGNVIRTESGFLSVVLMVMDGQFMIGMITRASRPEWYGSSTEHTLYQFDLRNDGSVDLGSCKMSDSVAYQYPNGAVRLVHNGSPQEIPDYMLNRVVLPLVENLFLSDPEPYHDYFAQEDFGGGTALAEAFDSDVSGLVRAVRSQLPVGEVGEIQMDFSRLQLIRDTDGSLRLEFRAENGLGVPRGLDARNKIYQVRLSSYGEVLSEYPPEKDVARYLIPSMVARIHDWVRQVELERGRGV